MLNVWHDCETDGRECETAECGMRHARECGRRLCMRVSECRMQNAKCGMREIMGVVWLGACENANAECRMWTARVLGVRSLDLRFLTKIGPQTSDNLL